MVRSDQELATKLFMHSIEWDQNAIGVGIKSIGGVRRQKSRIRKNRSALWNNIANLQYPT